jgi:hypothetical protein
MDTSLIQNLDFSKEHPQLSEILEKFQQKVKNIYQDQLGVYQTCEVKNL